MSWFEATVAVVVLVFHHAILESFKETNKLPIFRKAENRVRVLIIIAEIVYLGSFHGGKSRTRKKKEIVVA